MKRISFLLIVVLFTEAVTGQASKFITVKGKEIIGANGKPMLIRGTNLGNWLVPEGYMFKFKNTNSPKMISETITQVLGPEYTSLFWKKYLENYITESDIHFLKSIGVNSVRVPFHYRLFTNEDYLGVNDSSRGFVLLDNIIKWCKKEGLYVILDMHCAPAGQTGDNIDDSYGYPFLFESETAQKQTISIWTNIAAHYVDEPAVMGYDLLNEPIAHYFDSSKLNHLLEPFYKRLVNEIRKSDTNHLVFLGGAQWNTNFKVFGKPFDSKAVYTFHKYRDLPNFGSIKRFLDFREKYNVPIYIGETGENTDEWIQVFRILLENNHVGWHFWPYKKAESSKNIITFKLSPAYDSLVSFAESTRSSYKEIRSLAPNRALIKQALDALADNCLFENCVINQGYIEALGLSAQKEIAAGEQQY